METTLFNSLDNVLSNMFVGQADVVNPLNILVSYHSAGVNYG